MLLRSESNAGKILVSDIVDSICNFDYILSNLKDILLQHMQTRNQLSDFLGSHIRFTLYSKKGCYL